MQRKEALVEGEIYHVFNRGVEKRDIFSDDWDYRRFFDSLEQFNTEEPVELRHITSLKNQKSLNFSQITPPKIARKELVSILAYTLLPNHFHLLLRQENTNGITEFMRKVCTGYTMYFNQKTERVGPLFQGRFKSVHIGKESQFLYIPHYVHLNVLDVTHSGWKESGISAKKALISLKEYTWSSAREYAGVYPVRSIINRTAINDIFGRTPLDERVLRELIENPQ